MKVGYFITFEGGEGSGKSTQVKILADRLSSIDHNIKLTREPGGSPLAERLRSLILDPALKDYSVLTEALLFSAGRSDHLDQIIRPALKKGYTVICDRFSDSTRVYQGYAGKLEPQILKMLEMIVVGSTVPDLTIIIDLPANVGLDRAQERKKNALKYFSQKSGLEKQYQENLEADRYEARDIAYHEQLRQGYLEIAKLEPNRCVIIDGSNSIDYVARAIWDAVEARIIKRNS